MRFRTLVAAGLGAGLVAAPALADDGYRHGRIRFVEPGVTLQRATEVSAEEAIANLPFLPGDRVWTDSAGRAEFQFPDGTVVRLDRRSKLDYAGHEEGEGERIALRLWSGSVIVRRAHHRLRALRDRDPGRHGPGPGPRDRACGRRGGRDASQRLRRRGGAERRAAGASGSPPASARSRAGAPRPRRRGGSTPTRATTSPAGTTCASRRTDGPPAPPSTFPTSSTPTRASSRRTGSGGTTTRSAYVWIPRVVAGWQPVLERPLGMDALRLDLGPLRALGMGPLPLRALGLLATPLAGTGCRAAPGARPG